jgi:predicted site-specific integrase-resolvase
MNKTTNPIEWLNAQETADLFGIKLRTIREWTCRGKLKGIVFHAGRSVRYDKSKIMERIRIGRAFDN